MEKCGSICPCGDHMKNKLAWCSGVKNGITLIEPNENLASAYLKKSEDAMDAMHSVTSRDWKI